MTFQPFCAVCAKLHIAVFVTGHGRHYGKLHRLIVLLCGSVFLGSAVFFNEQASQSNFRTRYRIVSPLFAPDLGVLNARRYCLSSLPPGQIYKSFSASKVKSARSKVPSLRPDLSRSHACKHALPGSDYWNMRCDPTLLNQPIQHGA